MSLSDQSISVEIRRYVDWILEGLSVLELIVYGLL